MYSNINALKITNIYCSSKSKKHFSNLLDEIKKFIYCLYRVKEIIKKAYNNIMN